MVHDDPPSGGRASFSFPTRRSSDLLLVTVTVNPMASPAETEALSADLATSMAAPRTSTEAEAVSDPSLVVVTLAVLSTEVGRAQVGTPGAEASRVPAAAPDRTNGLH